MKEPHSRLPWDEYFMDVCDTVATRATCDRGRSGCLIVHQNQILVSGYVGSPPGSLHCDEVGHLLKTVIHDDGTQSEHCMRTIHAEQNAICQAAKRGIAIKDATLYCRMTPCFTCAMQIVSCGIIRVVCQKSYHRGAVSEELFKQNNIELKYFSQEIEKYPFKTNLH